MVFGSCTWCRLCTRRLEIGCQYPKLYPHTGTPVAGGFEVEQINFLLNKLAESKKTIIGFDLNEVGNVEWDANVGARVLYRLCNFLAKSNYAKKGE
ncbi:MAG: arginase family protein [Flavobacteriales bacterium]|nr:arginase family protein [Flavobacteriales bacterium]MCL4855865.1 arginase family protein [Flavobacteriales bacterium]